MMQDGRSKLGMVFIALVLVVVSFLLVIDDFIEIQSPYDKVMAIVPTEVAWVSTTMLMVFIFMHTRYYRSLQSQDPDRSSVVAGIAVFGLLSVLGVYAGGEYDLSLFNFSAVILIVAGICGGVRVSVPASLLCMVISEASDAEIDPYEFWYYVTMLTAAVLGGVVGGKKAPWWLIWAIPLIVTLEYLVNIAGRVYAADLDLTDELIISTISAFSMIAVCAYGISLFGLFIGMMKDRESADRSERDLSVAHDIQMSSVPSEFPVSRSLDIYARMQPATEVGGDFYDCFTISRNLTAFIVADVSDKGLPASMLMMRMMGSVKASSMLCNDPGKILTAVNSELCRNNPAEQFLTAWMGIYDSDTGILLYANAGHAPPYIRRAGGGFEKLEVRKGPIIGFSDAVHYKTSGMVLQDGDVLFAYTDGVNEAFNEAGEQFGHGRLCETLNSDTSGRPSVIIDRMFDAVKEFAAGMPASDDITMLSLRATRPPHGTITIAGKAGNLEAVNAFIEEVLSAGGCPVKQILKMQIVTEEIFVNICDHAYEGMDGDVTVYCRYFDNEIKITFSDDAEYFNPVNKEDIEIDEDVGNWPIGGFGIHMVRKLVTYMDYKYFAGKNIFTIWKRVE